MRRIIPYFFIVLLFFNPGNSYGKTKEKIVTTYNAQIKVKGLFCSNLLKIRKLFSEELRNKFDKNNEAYIFPISEIIQEINGDQKILRINGDVDLGPVYSIIIEVISTQTANPQDKTEYLIGKFNDRRKGTQTQATVIIKRKRISVEISDLDTEKIKIREDISQPENLQGPVSLFEFLHNINEEIIKTGRLVSTIIPYKNTIQKLTMESIKEGRLTIASKNYKIYYIKAAMKAIPTEKTPPPNISGTEIETEKDQEESFDNIEIWIAAEGKFRGSVMKLKFTYHFFYSECINTIITIDPQKSYITKTPALK